jgi:hypothetical protein
MCVQLDATGSERATLYGSWPTALRHADFSQVFMSRRQLGDFHLDFHIGVRHESG